MMASFTEAADLENFTGVVRAAEERQQKGEGTEK